MKTKLNILIAMVLLSILVITGCNKTEKASSASSDYSQEIMKKGEFVLGLDDSFPPMGFRDEKGEIVGFDIDLAKEAAKRMGLKVVLKPSDWDGIVMSLKNKNIDVIWNGLTITEERKKEINFTKTYLKNRQVIIVKADSAIADKAGLAGKVVGVQMGSSSENAMASFPDVQKSMKSISKYSNNTEALMELENGRVDAVVIDEVVGRYYISKKPGIYKVLEDNFGEEDYGVGVRKEDKEFLAKLEAALDSMKADGTADEIAKKWFGAPVIIK